MTADKESGPIVDLTTSKSLQCWKCGRPGIEQYQAAKLPGLGMAAFVTALPLCEEHYWRMVPIEFRYRLGGSKDHPYPGWGEGAEPPGQTEYPYPLDQPAESEQVDPPPGLAALSSQVLNAISEWYAAEVRSHPPGIPDIINFMKFDRGRRQFQRNLEAEGFTFTNLKEMYRERPPK